MLNWWSYHEMSSGFNFHLDFFLQDWFVVLFLLNIQFGKVAIFSSSLKLLMTWRSHRRQFVVPEVQKRRRSSFKNIKETIGWACSLYNMHSGHHPCNESGKAPYLQENHHHPSWNCPWELVPEIFPFPLMEAMNIERLNHCRGLRYVIHSVSS